MCVLYASALIHEHIVDINTHGNQVASNGEISAEKAYYVGLNLIIDGGSFAQ